MIIVDNALRRREAEGRPIKVGMIGAGFQGKGIARQIIRYTAGMRLCAIANTGDRSVQARRRDAAGL